MTAAEAILDTDLAVSLRVLFVEDNPIDANLMAATLKRAGYRLTVERVDTLPDFQERLQTNDYDVIIADYHLNGFTAMDGLRIVRECRKDVPFLVVSGRLGDEAAVECLKMGATDYVLKDRPARPPVGIARTLEERAERLARAGVEEELRSSEAKYRLLFEANALSTFVDIQFANDSC